MTQIDARPNEHFANGSDRYRGVWFASFWHVDDDAGSRRRRMPILADQARMADADNPRGYFELDCAKGLRHDSSWVVDAVGKAVKLVHLLLPDLPAEFHYRVIFMQRELSEVVASQRAMLERHARTGADLSSERLSQVFQQQLQTVQNWLGNQHNFSVLFVRYASMVSDPFPEALAINTFLGGELDIDRMVGAVDPALYRQRGNSL